MCPILPGAVLADPGVVAAVKGVFAWVDGFGSRRPGVLLILVLSGQYEGNKIIKNYFFLSIHRLQIVQSLLPAISLLYDKNQIEEN